MVEQESQAKLLGITLDDDQGWTSQISGKRVVVVVVVFIH